MNAFFEGALHTALTVHYDLMHVKYLGYVQYLYGSVLQILTHDIMDADPLTNLRTLWRFIKQHQRVEASSLRITAPYGQRLNKLTMFVKKKTYKLRGKAAEMRDLGGAVLAMWRYFAPPSQRNNEIHLLLRLNKEFEDTVDKQRKYRTTSTNIDTQSSI